MGKVQYISKVVAQRRYADLVFESENLQVMIDKLMVIYNDLAVTAVENQKQINILFDQPPLDFEKIKALIKQNKEILGFKREYLDIHKELREQKKFVNDQKWDAYEQAFE